MRHQLVLQFRGSSLSDLDAIVALEERLREQFAGEVQVDGHDIGSGEANIFIFTSYPNETFAELRPLLRVAGLLNDVTVAYRPVGGNSFTVVWPERSGTVFTVA